MDEGPGTDYDRETAFGCHAGQQQLGVHFANLSFHGYNYG
jgi:hypothetical protein